jgi:hypothetical protein
MRKKPAPRTPLAATAAVVVIAAGLVASCSAATGTPAASSTPAEPGAYGTLGASSAAAGTSHGPGIAPGSQATGTLANGTTWVADFPMSWNGTLVLYSHGYGALTAVDAPDSETQAALLADGYALAGSSYDPNGSEWALNTAVGDQFGALAAVESKVLPRLPAHVLAFGTSMGGLVSALEAQDGQGKIDGALTTCGVVAGGVSLNEYQVDGEYAIAQLLGNQKTQLVGLADGTASTTAAALNADAAQAQGTAAGQARLALAMAFLNVPAWDPNNYQAAPANEPGAEEEAQYNALMDNSNNVLDFIEGGRASIEQATGGQAAWTSGTNFAQVLAASPFKQEVEALYKAAGLSLGSDLATLTAHATIKADPAALTSLKATSDPTGQLAVPELDLHTIGDNLVPVENENYYARLVNRAGSGTLLRQAYTGSFGHCDFSVSEQVAGLQALLHRVMTGQWGDVATAAGLERAATALNLDPAHFTTYSPGGLTGANN